MLGRRSLRVKVMQVLYSLEMNRDLQLKVMETALENNIDRSADLYLANLAYIVEVCQYCLVDAAKRMNKYIKTEEDLNINTNIAANSIVTYLHDNHHYNEMIKSRKIYNYVDQDVVRSLFNTLKDKYTYKEYCAMTVPTLDKEKEVVGLLVKKILFKSKELESQLEEQFINYDDDQLLLNHVLQKYVEGFGGPEETPMVTSIGQWEEEKKFGFELLRQCVIKNDELLEDIKTNLQNWETDRIATLDMIIMKMAICELKYFPTIPVKVSINEYIDISKIYSTPKSKDFVNGVLDQTRIQLMDKGLINKQGRGLVDS